MTTTKTLTEPQADRVRQAAKSIRENPLNYDQQCWWQLRWRPLGECGTSACVAGWITHNDGWVSGGVYSDEIRRPRGRKVHTMSVVASKLIGGVDMTTKGLDGVNLFSADWLPRGLRWDYGPQQLARRVADALEALADGVSLEAVTMPYGRREQIVRKRADAGLS